MVERVTLYRTPTTAADANAIADWLRERVDARVLDPSDRETGNTMMGVVRYEQRALEHPERTVSSTTAWRFRTPSGVVEAQLRDPEFPPDDGSLYRA